MPPAIGLAETRQNVTRPPQTLPDGYGLDLIAASGQFPTATHKNRHSAHWA
jgi:hypothetical protein